MFAHLTSFAPGVEGLHGNLGFLAGLRVVSPFEISTSICRSSVTICFGLYLFIGMSRSPSDDD
jgi:hypothetical protein